MRKHSKDNPATQDPLHQTHSPDERGGEIIVEDELLRQGFVQVPVAIFFDTDLKDGPVRVYGALLWWAWKHGCAPEQKAMAEALGMGWSTVRRHLADLEKAGYIAIQQLGLGRPNSYVIRSLQRPPVPDRSKLSSLGAQKRAVKPLNSERSYHIDSDVEVDTEQQQRQPAAIPDARDPETAVVASHDQRPTANDLIAQLVTLGIAKTTARKLLKDHDPDLIYRWLCYTDYKLRSGWVPKESPAAWLVTALRSGDWVIPEWFQTPEEEAAARAERERLSALERQRREASAERERQEAAAHRRATEAALGIDEDTRKLWDEVRGLLQTRHEMSLALFSAFLLPLEDSVATIVTPVEFFCRMIADRSETVRQALCDVSGRVVKALEVRHVEM